MRIEHQQLSLHSLDTKFNKAIPKHYSSNSVNEKVISICPFVYTIQIHVFSPDCSD